MNLAKTARNAAVADIALAFARDRLAAQLPGVKPRTPAPRQEDAPVRRRRRRRRRRAAAQARQGHRAAPGPQRSSPRRRSRLHAAARLQLRRRPVRSRTPRPRSPCRPRTSRRRSTKPPRRPPPRPRRPTSAARSPTTPGPTASTPPTPRAPLAETGEGESEGEEQTDHELRDAAEGDEDDGCPEQAQIDEAIDTPPTRSRASRSSRHAAPTTASGAPGPGAPWTREPTRVDR